MFSENINQNLFEEIQRLVSKEIRQEATRKRTDNNAEKIYFISKDDIFGLKNSNDSEKKEPLYDNRYLSKIYEDVCIAIRSYESNDEFSAKHFVVILSIAFAPFLENNYLSNRPYKFKFKLKNTTTEAVYNFKDNLIEKQSDKEVENQYGIDLKKQPSALKIILCAIETSREYIELLTSCWINPKSYDERSAITTAAANPILNLEDKLNKILHLISKSVNRRIINDYLDIPKYLLFASTLVEYGENLSKKKTSQFNDYIDYAKKQKSSKKPRKFFNDYEEFKDNDLKN
ncbi:6891_t:CDS:1 [Racocetra persica]|uniref:6891_t:CDS:1 n=1 Tax=Racocetra persica TaxID=160502 RepID=A0ACA9R8G1_9GLOM|nr:6891_t:CDS:1 [Racocetra persica]